MNIKNTLIIVMALLIISLPLALADDAATAAPATVTSDAAVKIPAKPVVVPPVKPTGRGLQSALLMGKKAPQAKAAIETNIAKPAVKASMRREKVKRASTEKSQKEIQDKAKAAKENTAKRLEQRKATSLTRKGMHGP